MANNNIDVNYVNTYKGHILSAKHSIEKNGPDTPSKKSLVVALEKVAVLLARYKFEIENKDKPNA